MAKAGERASFQELRVSQLKVDLEHTNLEKKSLKTLADERLAAVTEAEGKLKKSKEEGSAAQGSLDGLIQEFRVVEDEQFTVLEADMAEYGKFVRDWAIQKIIQKYPHVDISDINFVIPVEEGKSSQVTAETVATPIATPDATPIVAKEQIGPDIPVKVEAIAGGVGATIILEAQTDETTAPTSGELLVTHL